MNSRPPALGGAYALFNLAYAAGLMLGPLLAGIATDLAGFPVALATLAIGVVILGAAGTARLPSGRGRIAVGGPLAMSVRDGSGPGPGEVDRGRGRRERGGAERCCPRSASPPPAA